MTKRDVAVWFCKVVALVGMISAAFSLLGGLLNLGIFGVFNGVRPVLSFGLYLFLWFFACGIGTELAAEGEFGPPIAERNELGFLLLRCVGLWIFLSASISFGPTFLALAYEYFSSGRVSLFGPNAIGYRVMKANLVASFLQSLVGFLLAFTPRIRAFFGK